MARRWLALIAIALVAPALLDPPARAERVEAQRETPLSLAMGQGTLLRFDAPVHSAFVADPDIADLQVAAARSVFVTAKRGGVTSIIVLGAGEALLGRFRLAIHPDLDALSALLARDLPDATIRAEATPAGLLLTGKVPDPASAERAESYARHFLGEKQVLLNRLVIAAPAQVLLRVRVAEVTRSVAKELGFNWQSLDGTGGALTGLLSGRSVLVNPSNPALPAPFDSPIIGRAEPLGAGGLLPPSSFIFGRRGSGSNLTVLLDALAEEGLATILAEPTLVALTGQTARFLAGGEFPIPVPQGLNEITVQFKQYGVALEFVPVVARSDRISITVRPEVSELTEAGGITVDAIRVPGLTVRRAETTVELGSGESFAIAGLLQNSGTSALSQIPGLGDVPILGALFRSTRYQRQESELMIVVTPYVVRPSDDPRAIALPTDRVHEAGDLERILLGRLEKRADPAIGSDRPAPPRLRGGAGFIVE